MTRKRARRTLVAGLVAAAGLIGTVPATGALPAAAATTLQQVMFVGNNWDGTVDVIQPSGAYPGLGRINVVPDRAQRLWEIYLNPVKLAFYLGVQQGPGEGHDQLVDDMYTTPDGSALVVSRPSFADVVSVDLRTGALRWRFPVSGYRADHMAVSPDGTRVAVSASTSNTVHVLDIVTGRQVGSFATGDKPHENVFTGGGRYLWNMSIGEVNTALDEPWLDWTKGDRRITVVDTATFQPVKVIDLLPRLDASGRSDLSDAVRPAVCTPDESTLYFQHGLSMSPDGTKVCVAGTMDDYATVVDRATHTPGALVTASKPYWATVSADGRDCVISESGADRVTAISFATGQKVASVAVGDHPQRVRLGCLPVGWTAPR